MARRRRRTVGVVALLLMAAFAVYRQVSPPPVPSVAPTRPPSGTIPGGYRLCQRVVDGDTVRLDSGERVRLIGVAAPEVNDSRPEVRQLAEEAAAALRRLCEGKSVRLDYDQQRADRYGRTLAYVYLQDGTFVNAEMVRQGYAHAFTRYPFRYMDEFRAHELEARATSRGLWK